MIPIEEAKVVVPPPPPHTHTHKEINVNQMYAPSMKFLLQVASGIRTCESTCIMYVKTSQFRNNKQTCHPHFLLISLLVKKK